MTDDTVFNKVEDKRLPASFVGKVLLENEIRKDNFYWLYATEYIDGLYEDCSDTNLHKRIELLLSIQEWRYKLFCLESIINLFDSIAAYELEDKTRIENVFAYLF